MEKKKVTLLHYATHRDTTDTKSMSAIRKSLASAKRSSTTSDKQKKQ